MQRLELATKSHFPKELHEVPSDHGFDLHQPASTAFEVVRANGLPTVYSAFSGSLCLDAPGTLSTRKGADDGEARDHQPGRTGDCAFSAAAVPIGLPEVSPSVGWRWGPRHPGTAG